MIKLKDLLTVDALSDARFDTLEVEGITADSRTVKPGDLFVAIAGSKDDGLRFVAAAVDYDSSSYPSCSLMTAPESFAVRISAPAGSSSPAFTLTLSVPDSR